MEFQGSSIGFFGMVVDAACRALPVQRGRREAACSMPELGGDGRLAVDAAIVIGLGCDLGFQTAFWEVIAVSFATLEAGCWFRSAAVIIIQ